MMLSVFLAAAIVTSVRGQPPNPPSAILFEGATIERTTAQDATDRYEVSLNEGDYLELSVPQDQAVVALSAYAPDGTNVHAIDVPDIDPLPQYLMLIASASGTHSIDVRVTPYNRIHVEDRPAQRRRVPGGNLTYTLRVRALRPATAADRERARLFELLEGAAVSERLGTMDGLRKAVPLYQQAASGWRSVGDVALEAETLEALAHLTGYFTQYHRDSIAAQERLTELYPPLGERWLEVHNLHGLGVSYSEGGRFEDAKRVMTRAQELATERGFQRSATSSVRYLGAYEFELGNYDQARELALQAQALAVAIRDPALEALTLSDLSRLDALAGDLDTAIARSRRGLQLAAGNVPALNRINTYLGFYHLGLGELDEAAASFEARLATMKVSVQRDQEALARLGLGDVLRARGDPAGARQRYEDAVSALEKGAQHWRCIAEQRLARMDLEDGRLDQAAARFDTMRAIADSWQNPECEAEARAGLADLAVQRGDLEAAEAEARRAVDLAETFRRATASPEARALGFGALAPAYERAIDVTMRRAETDPSAIVRAFTLSEHALSRGLLDRVSEARLDSRARVPATLAAEAHQVRERWRARLTELQVALRRRPEAADTKALVEETQTLEVQLRDLEAKIDTADPRHATFFRPRPLTAEAVQELLDADTLLLEYALGNLRSHLWVVSSRDIRALTLPPRGEIEALARRVHQQFARAPGAAVSPGDGRVAERDRRALARSIIEPALPLLAAKRLVVILPGALSLVPFGALPASSNGTDPLIARHEIVQVPSATTLAAMRMSTAGRPEPEKTAAVFADPVFDAQDPRVQRRAPAALRSSARSVPRYGGVALTRLPFSRVEAAAIASLAPKSVVTFLGLEAARERAAGPALSEYRFIHFATHGVVNQEVPSLSSIVLSLVDRAGRPRDGFLMLPDIYQMTLNADVVVLSGCQTALGRQVRGEGTIGLARAFMYAGVPRVVASLWPVDDLATSELMKRFYRGMLVRRLAPVAALRAAQRELAATERWRSPYFWAAFVLQGDWQ
jgi:CHAT domain-containing protein